MNSSTQMPSNDPKFILVVEDDAEIGTMLVQAIHSETPYQASLASNGLQAVSMAQTIRPQLFILDYNLPQTNGLEVYHRLCAIDGLQQTPVLFMSASPQTDEIRRQGMTLLAKPFDLGELLQTIDKLLA